MLQKRHDIFTIQGAERFRENLAITEVEGKKTPPNLCRLRSRCILFPSSRGHFPSDEGLMDNQLDDTGIVAKVFLGSY
jgi:hypothetical protein